MSTFGKWRAVGVMVQILKSYGHAWLAAEAALAVRWTVALCGAANYDTLAHLSFLILQTILIKNTP